MKNALGLAFYFIAVNGLIVLCAATAVLSMGRDELPTAVVAAGIGLAFSGIEAALLVTLAGKVSPRIQVSDGETTIRPDLVVDRCISWATVVGVGAVAVYAIFAPQGKIDLPLPYGSQGAWSLAAVVLTLTGTANIVALFKRGGNSFQRLDPHGFELGQGLTTIRGDWDDVVEIAEHRPGKPPPVRGSIFLRLADGRIRTQAVDSYTPRGRAMWKFVRFYWINPDKRDELSDGRAVARLNEIVGTT
ncbi:hypothetical protein [Mycobacterium sp. NPDC006124]|uniref:hypothetical protein n=1 Tax=Mycobacterium sp. NPDC006124 TaxID=3156729 RepID=UPI0033A7FF10